MNSATKTWWAALILGVLAVMPLSATLLNQDPPQVQSEKQEKKTSELKGKIKAVNAESQTLEIVGVDHPVEVTASTRFGTGLSLTRLKEGDEVRVVGFVRPDGKFEAREIRLEAAGD
jgi:hypothetical protein